MPREMVRLGGRSARIQAAVHAAARALVDEVGHADLTVPMIAERAGVTPSTIYRRWGDLGQLLADVAVERLRPADEPADTGSTAGDLEAFFLQYAEEMTSRVGRTLLRDVLLDTESDAAATRSCRYTHDHLDLIARRAAARGEPALDVAGLVDRVVAPIVYHILYGDREVTPAYCLALLAGALRAPGAPA